MMIPKDPTIDAVLNQLRSRLGPNAFILADHWDSDPKAIGIASPRDPGVLIYISTHGLRPGRFSYELELPPAPSDFFLYQPAGAGADVTFEELATIVDSHLRR